MAADSVSAWMPKNWRSVIGLPTPDAGEWALRDTPLTRGVLVKLVAMNVVEQSPRKREIPATETQEFTRQHVYETKRTGWEDFVKYAKLSDDRLRGFSADPGADAYVLDVFPFRSRVAADVQGLRDELDLEIQLVGVGPVEPEEYPGTFVHTVLETLRDPFAPEIRGLPRPDVLCVSPRLDYLESWMNVIENVTDEVVLTNPVEGAVDRTVRSMFSMEKPVRREVGRTCRPAVPGQKMLQHFNPDVIVAEDVEFSGDG